MPGIHLRRSSTLGQVVVLGALVVVACGESQQNGGRPNEGGAGNEGGQAEPGTGGTSSGTAQGGNGNAGAEQSEGAASLGGAAGPGEGGRDSTAGTPGIGGDTNEGGGGQATGGPDVEGCPAVAGAPIVSGTRLKAKCIRTADGAQAYKRGRLYDSELGDDCAYRTAADSSWRCLPTLHAPVAYQIYFSDDQCTVKMVWFEATCDGDVPKFLHKLGTNPICGVLSESDVPTSIYPVGAVLPLPDGLYADVQGDCVPQSKPAGKYIIRALGDELPVTSFVSGTKEVAP